MVARQERHGARGLCWPTGGPFRLSYLVELVSQQHIQEILYVLLVLHIQGSPMISPEAELPDNGVEPCTDLSDEIERILRPACAPCGWFDDLFGRTCCGGLGCSGLGREVGNACRECGGRWQFEKSQVSRALRCELMRRMPRHGDCMRYR